MDINLSMNKMSSVRLLLGMLVIFVIVAMSVSSFTGIESKDLPLVKFTAVILLCIACFSAVVYLKN